MHTTDMDMAFQATSTMRGAWIRGLAKRDEMGKGRQLRLSHVSVVTSQH